MELAQYFTYEPALNWAALPELPARLARHGVSVTRQSVKFDRFRERLELDSLVDGSREVLLGPAPGWYEIDLRGKHNGNDVRISIARFMNLHRQALQTITLSDFIDRDLVQSMAQFLGLQDEVPLNTSRAPERSAFVAHRFDELGTATAEKVSRFLELLGFTVVSGRGFSPASVAAKVRARLSAQAIVVVVLTPGDDATWLIQESVLGESLGKPLIVVRDHDAPFKPGLLADLEYIPFRTPHVETAFVSLLEGLRELGYHFG